MAEEIATVPLAEGQPVSWVVNRKVWLGGSVATFATALTGITIWVLGEFAGINIPAEIGAHLLILFGGLLAVIVYFVQAYLVTEPPTLPPGERAMHELVNQGVISRAQADEALTKLSR